MNTFVEAVYSESIARLAIGIEPIDAVRGRLVPRPLDLRFDTPSIAEWAIDRHRSGRFAIRFARGLTKPVTVRLLDPHQRYVPRRLTFPFDDVDAAPDPERRRRRPALYPGAAYDASAACTGLRGRVRRDGEPMRWARVEAAIDDAVVARAHGDQHGEFLLILGPVASDTGDLPEDLEIDVEVTVFGPEPAPVTPVPPPEDPLWDLPVEIAAAPGDPDPVTPGERLPDGYTLSVSRALRLPRGRITSVIPPFVIT